MNYREIKNRSLLSCSPTSWLHFKNNSSSLTLKMAEKSGTDEDPFLELNCEVALDRFNFSSWNTARSSYLDTPSLKVSSRSDAREQKWIFEWGVALNGKRLKLSAGTFSQYLINLWNPKGPPQHLFLQCIHRKKTFTGLMTNWHSCVPFLYKKSSVVSMIQQTLSICSLYSLLAKELVKIHAICQNNDYLIQFIDTRIGIDLTQYLNRNIIEPSILLSECEKRLMYVEIPFIIKETEVIKKKINRSTAESWPDLDICYVAKPPPSVRTLLQRRIHYLYIFNSVLCTRLIAKIVVILTLKKRLDSVVDD